MNVEGGNLYILYHVVAALVPLEISPILAPSYRNGEIVLHLDQIILQERFIDIHIRPKFLLMLFQYFIIVHNQVLNSIA